MKTSTRRLLFALGLLLVLAVGVLLLLPSPIDPAPFQPPTGPSLAGPLAPNETLREAELLGLGKIRGPEDVDVDDEGGIYGATEDGKIVRLTLMADGTERLETFAETGGRPLGMEFDEAGNLIVADASKGLLRIDRQGKVETLSTEADGVPYRFTDDLDIASDGRIFFSDASHRFGPQEYLYDLLEARPHGRLLVYDPATGKTTVLLEQLYFANGVALASDESFVLVNETYRYRIRRYWLKGDKAGTDDIFWDNLPGFADGVASDRRGRFWVAMFTVRNPLMDRLHPSPFLKSNLAKLPKALWPKPAPYGFVVVLDETGEVIGSLHDPGGEHITEITSAEPAGEYLYLGTLHQQRIGRLKLPQHLR
jgi:sugar lactone lactonase YvrE